MKLTKIIVQNTQANLDILSGIELTSHTSWITARLIDWAQEYFDYGEKPAPIEFSKSPEMIELLINHLGLDYSKIYQEYVFPNQKERTI